MKTLKATTIILVAVCSQGFIPTGARAQQKSHLEVLEVKPDPIRRGRNVVNAKIRNTSSEDQALSLEIRTEGPGGNWQTQFPHVIPGGATQWIRQAYIINGFVAEDLRIRMRFYATGPASGENTHGAQLTMVDFVQYRGAKENLAIDAGYSRLRSIHHRHCRRRTATRGN